LPADTLGWLRTLLRRCLQKDPKKRLPHIGLARIEIEEAPSISDASVSTPTAFESARLRRKARLAWSLVGVTSVALLAVAIPAVRHVRETPRPPSPAETRLEIITPSTTDPTSLAISPDGRQIVFVASGDGQSRLWLRPLASASARPLEGTEGANYPFWSPDSKSVGFFADAKLKRLDIGGGSPQSLTDLSGTGFGGAWNANGTILFSSSVVGPLQRISASGGEAVPFTTLDRQISHKFPLFLPDGRQFLFYARGTSETQGIYLGSLDAKNIKRLTFAETAGVYVPAGWLLWVRGSTLVAQRLDLERQELVGDQISVAAPVAAESPLGVAAVSVSADGLIAYRTGGTSRRQLVWFNRAGKALGAFGIADEATLSWPRISPDGRRVTVYRMVQGNQDLWLLDGVRENRFTFDAALDRHPVWSPDGSRIVFDSNRSGSQHLYIRVFGGIASEELLLESQFPAVPISWSADGRYLLYVTIENSGFDQWVLPMEGDKKPWPFLKTNVNEGDGEFSPDGRWVAYDSDQSGRIEVYVRPFVERATANQTVGQWQVSTAGGMQPRWAANGNELYYVAPGGRLMAVPITAVAATFQAGAPTPLFAVPMVGAGTNVDFGRQYDVARDGRFLINTVVNAPSPPITIVQNWTAGLTE
jgi:eukaryotic-like serine/threonine-protein kinase